MVKYLSKSFIINFLLILIIFFLDRFSKIYVINFYEKNYGSDLYNSKFLNISGQGSRNEARFIFTPLNLGENEYIVKVSSLSEEINIDNNQQKFLS